MTDPAWRHQAIVAAFLVLSTGGQANADCAFEPQGEGRVAAVIDARSFRLDDGREVRLAGIERAGTDKASSRTALAALVSGRDVTLHGEDDAPDRYGRQPAFVFADGSETSGAGRDAPPRRGAGIRRSDRQGLRGSAGRRRGGGAAGQNGNLGSIPRP